MARAGNVLGARHTAAACSPAARTATGTDFRCYSGLHSSPAGSEEVATNIPIFQILSLVSTVSVGGLFPQLARA